MNLKFFVNIFVLFWFSHRVYSSTNMAVAASSSSASGNVSAIIEASRKECRQSLLISYGFSGNFSTPQPVRLDMCKAISNSCCSVQDQTVMYRSFISNGEADQLQSKIQLAKSTYEGLLTILESVWALANRLMARLNNAPTTNCKIMARRIMDMKVKDVGPKIKKAIDEMFTFLQVSHKGLYCMLCDGDNQQFFNLGRNQITYSSNFCRQLAIKSLTPLIYMHNHLANIVNLAVRFVQTCDANGAFKANLSSPTDPIPISVAIKDALNNCKLKSRSAYWLEYCGSICKAFNPVVFSEFFTPSLDEYIATSAILSKQLLAINMVETVMTSPAPRPLSNPNSASTQMLGQRVLQANSSSTDGLGVKTDSGLNNPLVPDLRQSKNTPTIFSPGLQAIITLDSFTFSVKLNGTNPYDAGVKTFIDDEVFNSLPFFPPVKTLLPTANATANGTKQNTTKKTSSVALVSIFLILLQFLI